jgi:N-acetylmuramoyl-L-alanine amidase
MMRYLWLFFLHVSLLFAANDSETLKRAAELTKSGSKTEVFRAYNDYKNIYLRSVMSENDDLRKKALNGIVITGKKLRIDVSKYKKELAEFEKTSKSSKSSSKKSVTKKKSAVKSETAKSGIAINKLHHLKSIGWEDGRIVAEFDAKLLKTDINYFKLIDKKKKSYRYIFDIHASMSKSEKLQHKKIKRIRLAQYRHDTLRLVIENSSALHVRFSRKENKLIINPNVGESTIKSVAKNSSSKVSPFANKVVVLDPGHGGKDAGAVGYKKYREKVVVLQISQEVAKRLRKEGVKVHMTRTSDKFLKLRTRTKFANNKKADLFVSVHANSVPKKNATKAKGIETYFLSPSRSSRATRVAAVENSKEIEDMNYFGKNNFLNFLNREKIISSNKLAIDIQRGMLGKLQQHYKGVKDNGVREGPFWVLVGAQMPAVLVEVGFISHPTEAVRMVNKSYQKRLAEGMAEGILRYFINNP